MAPGRIKLAYVSLSLDALQTAAAPSADVLKVLYDAEKQGRFTTAEERKARHILIKFGADKSAARSEEHTSELQSLMRISYAVFCLQKEQKKIITIKKGVT